MGDVAKPAWDGPVPDEAGFREWMLVRSSALRRKAFLLCGDWSAADDLVQDVLVAMYPRWSRIVRGGQVDAYANRVLVGKHVDARRRPWRRELPVDGVPDSVDSTSERAIAAVDERDGPLMAALAALPAGQSRRPGPEVHRRPFGRGDRQDHGHSCRHREEPPLPWHRDAASPARRSG